MKFNHWTVALAGLGLVSLASVAQAEEKASSVLTAVSSTTLSGYVDTSAHWNLGTGNAFQPQYKFNTADKADGFNLNVVQLRIEKPLDEEQWAAGYRVDLWAGPDANTLGTQSLLSDGSSDFAIRQAYVALRMPIGNGLDWKVGVFDGIIGYESVESPTNPNYTRSYGHSIEPQTHTGVLATYRFNDLISASGGIADTYGPTINERAHAPFGDHAESYKTYMASVALTAPDSFGALAGSTLYGGFVNGFSSRASDSGGEGSINNLYAGAAVATPITNLRVGAAFDWLNAYGLNGETYSVAGYASYQATEKLSFHGRGEFLKDNTGAVTGVTDVDGNFFIPTDKIVAFTATAQYDLWQNVISRLEFRWDHSASGNDAFGGTNESDGPDLKNSWLIAANIIYRF
jgi:hypothetical protein